MYLWAQLTLPPITLSGVDQAPNQRLFSHFYGPFDSTRAFFFGGTLTPLPILWMSVLLLPRFSPLIPPFSTRTGGKTTLVGIELRTSLVCL